MPANVPDRTPRADRDVLDRLQARMPGLSGLMLAGVRRMPSESSLRRRAMQLALKRAFAAMNRSDVDALGRFFEPDAVVTVRGMAGVGVSDGYVGHEGLRELFADIDDAYGEWGYTIRSVVDVGDRLAVRTDFVGRGRSSGVETALTDAATLLNLSTRGKVAQQDWFVQNGGWQEAMSAMRA
jgi:SnoaL-like domain